MAKIERQGIIAKAFARTASSINAKSTNSPGSLISPSRRRTMYIYVSSSPSKTRRAASRRRLSNRTCFGSGFSDVVMFCSSKQTLPRLWNSRSKR